MVEYDFIAAKNVFWPVAHSLREVVAMTCVGGRYGRPNGGHELLGRGGVKEIMWLS